MIRTVVHGFGLFLLVQLPLVTLGQESASDGMTSFEVASVKLVHLGPERPINRETDAVFEHSRTSLFVLILRAYGLQPHQLICPEWMRENVYEIVAHIPTGATKADIPAMLRRLLAERFGLSVRRELRSVSVYALEVAKGGPKLRQCAVTTDQQARVLEDIRAGLHISNAGECPADRARISQDSLLVETSTLTYLTRVLQRGSDRPIVDRTGMAGHFTIAFESAPLLDTGDTTVLPTLPAALEKLGLRLDTRREVIEHVIIVHCDKIPTEN